MRVETVRSPVIGTTFTRLLDFEGTVDRVICPEYQAGGTCRLKQETAADAPLSRLLERVQEGTVAEHTQPSAHGAERCDAARREFMELSPWRTRSSPQARGFLGRTCWFEFR
jgi:hypothetical protein